jgi:hypothetical protein
MTIPSKEQFWEIAKEAMIPYEYRGSKFTAIGRQIIFTGSQERSRELENAVEKIYILFLKASENREDFSLITHENGGKVYVLEEKELLDLSTEATSLSFCSYHTWLKPIFGALAEVFDTRVSILEESRLIKTSPDLRPSPRSVEAFHITQNKAPLRHFI